MDLLRKFLKIKFSTSFVQMFHAFIKNLTKLFYAKTKSVTFFPSLYCTPVHSEITRYTILGFYSILKIEKHVKPPNLFVKLRLKNYNIASTHS